MNTIRALKENELPYLIEVQKKTFTSDLCESLAVFKNRFDRFGQFFRVATIDDQIVGYIICFPYELGEIPKNNAPFEANLKRPDCFYIHDVTLIPEARGQGLAQLLIESAFNQAKDLGFTKVSLVSVGQSGNYWDKLGFIKYPQTTQEILQKLHSSYDEKSRLMVKDI